LPSFRRRPYGEGQLEPDLEHQDAKEEPGEKGKEQDQEEVGKRFSGLLSGTRLIAKDPGSLGR
jgi:hypothetical protein